MPDRKPRKVMNGAEEPTGTEYETVTLPEEEEVSTEDSDAKPQGHFHTSVHKGMCHGGPMDGMEGASRYPKGFVLMDAKDSRAWVYDRHGDAYVCREVDVLDRERGAKAAEEANYDVRAYDRETMRSH